MRLSDEQRERQRGYELRHRERVRAPVFDYYGWSCVCCGASEELEIDHVVGGGRAHRDELIATGLYGRKPNLVLYVYLVAVGFPEGYQTMCATCNKSKGVGHCCKLIHA